MSNFGNIFSYILMGIFFIVSLWGTYTLTKPTEYDDEKKCKCSK